MIRTEGEGEASSIFLSISCFFRKQIYQAGRDGTTMQQSLSLGIILASVVRCGVSEGGHTMPVLVQFYVG